MQEIFVAVQQNGETPCEVIRESLRRGRSAKKKARCEQRARVLR
jgi:hypothetical protein